MQATLRQEGLIGQLRSQRPDPVTLPEEESQPALPSPEHITTPAPPGGTSLLNDEKEGKFNP